MHSRRPRLRQEIHWHRSAQPGAFLVCTFTLGDAMSLSAARWHHQAGWQQLDNGLSSVAVPDLVIVAGDQYSQWQGVGRYGRPYLADPVLPPLPASR